MAKLAPQSAEQNTVGDLGNSPFREQDGFSAAAEVGSNQESPDVFGLGGPGGFGSGSGSEMRGNYEMVEYLSQVVFSCDN